jgi:dye decolorizing peroxidase
MNGFRGAAASTSSSNGRNLMGQIDGTNNIAVSRTTSGGPVWIDHPQPGWMAGGSYVAVRRFRMLLSDWEASEVDVRDRAVGRHVSTGAPLGMRNEFDPVDLDATDSSGAPVIPADAHIRLSAPRPGAGEEMLRRSYSYSMGQAGGPAGDEDAGLIFVSYQSDPRTSFIPVQRRLAGSDALARFTVATSSALFAVLPGVADEGDWYGRALLG